MTTDPILDQFSIWFRRAMLFLVLSLIIAMAIWLWVLLAELNLTSGDLPFWLKNAWTPSISGSKLPAIILCGALTIGVLSASVLYLIIGKWWKKRGDVHHRGARFDEREA